jgi:hypothetical protein
MREELSGFFRSAYAHFELNEILQQATSALLGVSQAAEQALIAIGIKTVFDLGTAWIFMNARAASEAGKVGELTARLGVAPSDWLKPSASWSALEEIGNLDLVHLRGIDDNQATQLKLALDVITVRDFALYPPHLVASRLVRKAAGSTFDNFEDQEAAELRPRFGEYPTERVYYSTLVMLQMQHDGERQNLDGPVSLKPAVNRKAGFNKPAIGAQLTVSQSWYAQGITLGQMLHSLALAPGEATRIAVIDWSRRTRASATESISENEQLDNSTLHSRALSEVQNATAVDVQQGGSMSQSSSTSSSSSFAIAAGTGLIPSLWANVDASGGGQTASTQAQASSASWSLGTRSVNAQMTQNVNDRTEQHSTSVRNRRATAVREVAQSEHEQVSTRIVANYNHMHALTVQYYEVVQIYRVAAQLHHAERCLFIPMELFTFEEADVQDTIERFRGALIPAALTQRARSLLIDDTTGVEIKPVLDVKVSSSRPGFLYVSPPIKQAASQYITAASSVLKTAAIEDKASEVATAAEALKTSAVEGNINSSVTQVSKYVWDQRDIAYISRIIAKPIIRPDSDNLFFPDDAEIVGLSFENLNAKNIRLDRTGIDTSDNTFTVPANDARLDVPSGIRLIDVEAIWIAKADDSPRSGKLTIQLSYFGRRFNVPSFPVELSSGMEMQRVADLQNDQADRRRELLAHLKANHVHYSQAIFRALDTPTIVMLLSQYDWNGKPLADQVEPRPISVVGNYLVLRAPIENQDSSGVVEGEKHFSWQELLETRGIEFGESDQRLIPIPTAGVFAEAVLGRSNSAEKLDITRFWNWQDSPIPLQPTEIAPVSTGTRAQPEDLKPGQLGQPVLNLVNPTSLPDPAGLGAVLNAIANGNMFRDMSGLAGTQSLVQSGMAGTLQAATDAGQLASENMRISAQKAVAMAQVAADIIKAAMGASGGSSSIQGVSGDGARINHGRDMDQRGVPVPSGNSNSSTGSSFSSTPTGSNSGGNGGGVTGGSAANSFQGSDRSSYSHEGAAASQATFGYSPDAVNAITRPYQSTGSSNLDLQQIGDTTYARPAGQIANHIVGQMGELLAEESLKKQGHIVFRDWQKGVQGNGVDLFSLAPLDPLSPGGRELWILDNKAQLRGISGAEALVGPQAVGNLDEIENFLKNTWPNKDEANLALKALRNKRIKLVVSNGFAGETTRFTKAVFEKGLAVYDLRLGKLYTSHKAWEEAFKQIRSSLRKGVRLTGLRGAALMEGTFLIMAVAAGTQYLFRNGTDVKDIAGEIIATYAVDSVVNGIAKLARLPVGWAASFVIGMESDETPESRELRKLREALVPNYFDLSKDDQKATDAALLEIIRNPLKIEVPPEPKPRPTWPGFDIDRWGAPRTDTA